MGRIEKGIFLGVLAVLLLSLGMMFLQGLTDTGAPKVYHISVLLDGTGDEYWRNFRKGVDRAARETNADVRFVTRYEGDAAKAQVEALRQEWEGEADGVIVVPVDGGLLAAGLLDARADLKLVVAGPDLGSDRVSSYVWADSGAMGRRLAQAVADGGHASCTVVRSSDSAREGLFKGLTDGLDELDIPWEEALPDGELPREGAVAALTPGDAEALCRRTEAAGRVYGIGTSNRLLHCLEEGTAAALVVQSDYDAGYLRVKRLVSALQGRAQDNVTLDCYTVTAENMFTDPIDQILVPIG